MDDEAAFARLGTTSEQVAEAIVIPNTYNGRSQLSGAIKADGPNELNFELLSQD